ncbi:MAG TPA: N-6 DNA methylase, partial [Thermomicrobiales bacterium]
ERFRLADNEQTFWQLAELPTSAPDTLGERFVQYLQRALRQPAPLTDPADVAWFLASYAREALARIEHRGLPGLVQIRKALEETLGLTFEGERGDHFFRSTLVQTLFYGVFSSWVLWCKQQPAGTNERFDWHDAQWSLHVPVINVLFEQVATRSRLEPLGLVDVLDWAGDALNRVQRDSFFARFEEEHAVQYFYEPFLEAFDPELRKQLGVWYTPPEVVKYMVTRVDTVLRQELGRPDGFADPDVYVLDPCTGTGSYPIEVLRHVAETLRAKGEDALSGDDLKRAALHRIVGFEILPAPFVVAHLQIGLLLQQHGAPLSTTGNERAAIYLTNALTGWHTGAAHHEQIAFPELETERDAADQIKRRRPILVILGNPPYNGYAGVAVAEERVLSDAYRVARTTKQPQGQGLNDLYVRFFRMAERKIVELTGEGIVCLISNYSWLDGLSFTAMRERFLDEFDSIRIDCLNGDKYKTGKLTPDGQPDPSIFSTERNREGIQVGTAIALMVRKKRHVPSRTVLFRHL